MIEKKTIALADAKGYLSKIPFYLEDFEKVSVDRETYTAEISPLFAEDIIDGSEIPTAIRAAIDQAPLFHAASTTLGTTRDPATLDVPSALQTEFWQSLFKDTIGAEDNNLLTAAYNRLRYTYLSEENILFSGVFKQFLSDNEAEAAASFAEDVEASDAIIEAKLNSAYALLNYKPLHSSFIDGWLESLYLSGQITATEKATEENLYKIQDVKSELLRRKFAGSSTLYDIILSAVNRRGAYVPVVPLKSVAQQGLFQDNRFIRALDMPGITTIPSDTVIDPLTAFAENIPIRTLSAMYYSSNNYDAESFVANRAYFLRNRSKGFSWDNIKGILDPSLVKKTYPKLDQTNPNTHELYKLDTTWVESGNTISAKLDDAQPMFDLSATTAGFFDIQADQLLFIRNTIQRSRNHEYPYMTYSIADGAGPCMMDIPWLDYIEKSVTDKKRTQEKLQIGVQVSRYVASPRNLVEENFTVITFSATITDDFDSHASRYTPDMKYAFLWNIKMRYDRDTFEVKESVKEIMTYLLLCVDSTTLSPSAIAKHSKHKSYSTFTAYTTGLLPFSYPDLKSQDIISYKLILNESTIQDDLYEEEYTKAFFLFTPYEQVAISKMYMKTNPGALRYSGNWFNAPLNDAALKHVIYGLQRTDANGDPEYFWSDPMRLYPKEIASIKEFKPDWMDMVMYINPYLSHMSDSASPLRHRETLPRALRPATYANPTPEALLDNQIGAGTNTALSNLNTVHGMHLYCNESGSNTDANWPRGSYLHKVRPASTTVDTELLGIWGDNRALWGTPYAADPMDDWDGESVRTTIAYDAGKVPCLKLATGLAYTPGTKVDSWYTIAPDNTDTRVASWADWQWNDVAANGLTFCIDLAIAHVEEDQWMASRNLPLVGTEVHAEFDAYLAGATEELVFKVYPTGKAAELALELRLAASHILIKQSQLAFSYKATPSTENLNQTNLSMIIVADRAWAEKYFATVKTGAASYDVYETDSTFTVDGLTAITNITLSTPEDYEVGYTITNPYRFGNLVKYKGQLNNSLKDICLLSREYGYNPLRGTVYDIRLYNRGMSLEEAIIYASGTRRELYSYSPSLYKLSYQQHSDAGILRRQNNTSVLEEVPGRVRIFQRDVWDSIVCDLYPISAAEKELANIRYRADYRDPLDDPDVYDQTILPAIDYKLGVVDQMLVGTYESLADMSIETSVDVFYKNEKLDIPLNAIFSLAQTSIYPRRYTEELFTSGLVLKRDTTVTDKVSFKAYHSELDYLPAGAHSVEIPSIPSGDTLEYKATFDLDFTMSNDIDAAVPLARGANIKIEYDKEMAKFVVGHVSTAVGKNAQADFALYPLYIASQGSNELLPGWRGTLSGFEFKGLRFSSALSKLLDARSYYSELQIPYAYTDPTSPTGYRYTSRWDGIRALKDGEYYVTCKYPVKILPFENHNTAMTEKAVITYAAVRLKVVATSSPMYYDETGMPTYRAAWEPSNIDKTLSVPFAPVGNRSFPHRVVNLDLYAMRNESTSGPELWKWIKIASNYDTTAGVQLIDKPAGQVVFPGSIPAYFTRTYNAPFFVEGPGKTTVADTMKMYVANAAQLEKLAVSNTADLDTITLLSGRSYRVMLDYTANVAELAYSADSFMTSTPDTPVQDEYLGSDELAGYSRLTSIIDSLETTPNAVAEYMYTSELDWTAIANGYDVNNTKTGYYVESSNSFRPVNVDIVANDLALGDPYSNAVTKNKAIAELPVYRFNIANSCFFTYRQENKALSLVLPPHLIGTPMTGMGRVSSQTLMLVSRNPFGEYILKSAPVREHAIIVQHFRSMKSGVLEAFRALSSSTNGLIASFSGLKPVESQINTTEYLNTETHTLVTYRSQAFSTPLSLGVTVTKKGLYQTNLIASQNFLDYSIYKPMANSSFVYDSTKAKDVFSFVPAGTTAAMSYLQDIGASSVYEAALSVFCPVAIKVAIKYYAYDASKKGAYSHLTAGTSVAWASAYVNVPANTWTVVSWETPSSIDPSMFDIVFARQDDGAFAGEAIRVNKLVVRRARVHSHKLGLSNAVLGSGGALVTGQANVAVSGSSFVAFQQDANKTYFPLQFKNKLVGAAFNMGEAYSKTFIGNYNLLAKSSGYSEVVPMMRPWTRVMVFKESEPRNVKFFKYTRRTKEDGTMVTDLTRSVGSSDIFAVYNDFDDANIAHRSLVFNQLYNDIEYTGDYGLVVNESNIQGICEANITPNLTDLQPIEERFSLISGCVDPDKFIAKKSSVVGITNIQVLNNDDENPAILYELEYLPIIYDESKHHLSLNFLTRSL